MIHQTDDQSGKRRQAAKPQDSAKAPVPPEQAAEEIADIGVEGRPPDPKGEPARVWSELGVALALILCLTGLLAWAIGWAAGVAALVICLIALVLNPVVSATMIRAHDRQLVSRRHDGDQEKGGAG